jgi:hypothetical protein
VPDHPKIPFNLKPYVCIDVFKSEKPVLPVSRSDGEWCFLCGSGHPDSHEDYRVVCIGHVIERDKSLKETLDLPPDWEAERGEVGGGWIRTQKCG